jgi:hypothetical protein
MKRTVVVSAPTLEELQAFVHRALCQRDKLDPQQTPIRSSVIRRSGRTCGMFFQVQGPRLLSSYAVWAGDENRIILYDSSGARAGEVALSDAPDAGLLAA